MTPTVFLDLDGTLTDPKPGITGSVRYALDRLGLAVPEADDLEWVIGPALLDSFARLGVPDPAAALALYRERYTVEGLYENRVYDGIPEALARLHGAGLRLCLATAKPIAYARRITAHFGLSPYLAQEFGPDLDGRLSEKGDLLAHALAATGARAGTAIMVGDRAMDIAAAERVGMASVWVPWGYGPGEGGAATYSVPDPAALAARLLAHFGLA